MFTKKCNYCGSKITRKAPLSAREGNAIGMKLMSGQISDEEVDAWYKSLGTKCPKCGKLSCSFCYDSHGRTCPNCASKMEFFN